MMELNLQHPTTLFEMTKIQQTENIEKFLEQFWIRYAAKNSSRFCAEMGRYQLSTGGKRLRALLPPYIFQIFGEDPKLALPLGAAVELIHNATLVHDDIQDGDQVRR